MRRRIAPKRHKPVWLVTATWPSGGYQAHQFLRRRHGERPVNIAFGWHPRKVTSAMRRALIAREDRTP